MATDRPAEGAVARQNPPIKAVMTPFPHWVDADQTVAEARSIMVRRGVRHLPVKNASGRLVGIVTDRDIKLILGPYTDAPPSTDLRVRSALAPDSYVVDLETPLDQVAAHLAEHRLGAALVIKSGRLAGIFTTVDACRLLAELIGRQGPDDRAA